MRNDFNAWANDRRARLEIVLSEHIVSSDPAVSTLVQAMRYATLDGGKRFRALLVYATGEMLGAAPADLDLMAAAIECIHAYSLVHDDLPCMDNDLLRRGKPSCFARFGEAQAMLAGDALQPLAFEFILATGIGAEAKVAAASAVARACGCDGMCGGQHIDLSNVGNAMDLVSLEHMHALKTGCLIGVSVLLGALAAPRCSQRARECLERYSASLGLAFQVVDDILDATADTATLGKTAGKDEAAGKPTFVTLKGLDGARELAARAESAARAALEELATGEALEAQRLFDLSDFVVRRNN